MKRIILVHGWVGGPDKDWFPWMRAELEKRGYAVVAPLLPDPDEPRIETWVPALRDAVGEVDAETYFVAHSMGCQTTMRLIESLPEGSRAGGAVFVAGFLLPLVNLEGPEEEEVAQSWTGSPLDLAKVHACLPKVVEVISDDDPWVTMDNAEMFKEGLGAEIVIEHGQEHFTEDENQPALDAILKLAEG